MENEKKHFYIVKLTNCEIPIDQEEVAQVIQAINKGSVKVLKRGVMNPSFFVGIVEDTDRENGWNREAGRDGKYIPTSKQPLPDLFPTIRAQIESIAKGKQIGRSELSLQEKND